MGDKKTKLFVRTLTNASLQEVSRAIAEGLAEVEDRCRTRLLQPRMRDIRLHLRRIWGRSYHSAGIYGSGGGPGRTTVSRWYAWKSTYLEMCLVRWKGQNTVRITVARRNWSNDLYMPPFVTSESPHYRAFRSIMGERLEAKYYERVKRVLDSLPPCPISILSKTAVVPGYIPKVCLVQSVHDGVVIGTPLGWIKTRYGILPAAIFPMKPTTRTTTVIKTILWLLDLPTSLASSIRSWEDLEMVLVPAALEGKLQFLSAKIPLKGGEY